VFFSCAVRSRPKGPPFHSTGRFAIRFEAAWYVIIVEAVEFETIFESGPPPTVTEHITVPDALPHQINSLALITWTNSHSA
jgi:hypothetical protein